MSITSTNSFAAEKKLAVAIRLLCLEMIERAQSGHPGLPLGMADVTAVLWQNFLRLTPTAPAWLNRDRVVLSAGHGSTLLYALGHLAGYQAATLDELKNFRQLHSKTPGHPMLDLSMGVECATGSLGQGFAMGVGMALAARHQQAKYGAASFDHKIYIIASDGDLMEGISHEAASFAGHQQLGNLIVLYDDNRITIDGSADLAFTEDVDARFAAYGWGVQRIDGHDYSAIHAALTAAQTAPRPTLIICSTTIGQGLASMAGTPAAHANAVGAAELAATRAALTAPYADWPTAPLAVPADVPATLQNTINQRSATAYSAWQQNFGTLNFSSAIPAAARQALHTVKQEFATQKFSGATRAASGKVLAAIAPHLPNLIGGSADLSASNNTRAPSMQPHSAANPSGTYVHYGVREHAMAGIMNGLALHSNLTPYGGTFLAFADYCRHAIRLSALMQQRVIYVLTHDSIGLGEDGAIHQPIEHLAGLRAMPNLLVLRPADAIEVAECWELALQHNGPSVLALSRQEAPALRTTATITANNKCATGAYVLAEPAGAQLTITATGTEVFLAQQVAAALHQNQIAARVVSLPCMSLFLQQPPEVQQRILQPHLLQVGIEAAAKLGWGEIIGADGLFFGMQTFGASGTHHQLYQHFGLTAEVISSKILQLLGR